MSIRVKLLLSFVTIASSLTFTFPALIFAQNYPSAVDIEMRQAMDIIESQYQKSSTPIETAVSSTQIVEAPEAIVRASDNPTEIESDVSNEEKLVQEEPPPKNNLSKPQDSERSAKEEAVMAILKRSTFELGGEISHIKYQESKFMREKGVMYGIDGSYAYHNNIMLKLEGRGSWGSVDYRSDSGPINNIRDYMLEFRVLSGYDFPVSEYFILTPYIGFGYRYLNDALEVGANGYDRESNYYYSPVGLEDTINLPDNWSIGLSGEYDFLWFGKQFSHLSEADPGLNDIVNHQSKGHGIRASLKLKKKTRMLDFTLGPFVRYWNIKQSKISDVIYYGFPVTTEWEPSNRSTEIGCNFSVGF